MVPQPPNRASGDSGFTIIEVLIALQLTLLIVSMAYTVHHFSSRLIRGYERKLAVERELSLVSHSLSRTLSQVRTVQKLSPREFSAMRSDGRSLYIRLEAQVFLNGEQLGSGLLTLHGGRISGPGAEGETLPLAPYAPKISHPQPQGISLTLLFRDGEAFYPLNLTVRLVRQTVAIVNTSQPPGQ